MEHIRERVFENYQVRKNKKQKAAFADFVREVAEGEGYAFSVEKASFGARNIVVGNPDEAKVVYTAHYDTCAVMPMPNFITPKNILIYLLYQLVLVFVIMILPAFLIEACILLLLPLLGVSAELVQLIGAVAGLAALIAAMLLLIAGPANKHTANDNTSGVMTLFSIMKALPEERRGEVAFIFFDLEEAGLIGSSGYAAKHKKQMKDKLLINFDCVSDGKNIIFALRKGAVGYKEVLTEAFAPSGEYKVEVLTRGVFYPSDQAAFPCGVGVASLKKSKRLGILYMNRIHTPRDTVFDYDNIEFLTRSAITLSGAL